MAMAMATTKLVCSLDVNHAILRNGHLMKDSRFNYLDDGRNIEIDLLKLTSDESTSRVLKNVTVEETDEDWVTNIQTVMGRNWVVHEVSDAWKIAKKTIIDIDFSEATTYSGQVYGRIMNIRPYEMDMNTSGQKQNKVVIKA